MFSKTKTFGLLLIVVFMICFSACKKTQIVGTWVEVNNQESGVEISSDGVRYFGEDQLITSKILCKFKGDKIVANFMGMEAEMTYKISDNGNVLTLEDSDGRKTIYKRKGK